MWTTHHLQIISKETMVFPHLFVILPQGTSCEHCSKPLLIDDFSGFCYPLYIGDFHNVNWQILPTIMYHFYPRKYNLISPYVDG